MVEAKSEMEADFPLLDPRAAYSTAMSELLRQSEMPRFLPTFRDGEIFPQISQMSLPYRFKAGGSGAKENMAPIYTSSHHHRSTTKQSHKPFKPRFTSKGALKDIAKGRHRLQP
jgi:hypothetical protein